ncbi:hypothetical protein [Sphingopyxis flava]|uniref:Tetratricopeptide repeat-containing protein n=1 Tax=Sphingopyxis flava TaxID=1507287 RepID=A0A1T5CST4_9SPHN|nr:hypothetical protein [Sphingopyxis flava]SKB62558.1 hypothetical protein SAMN06295937_101187 [Sphingopyxis flava]
MSDFELDIDFADVVDEPVDLGETNSEVFERHLRSFNDPSPRFAQSRLAEEAALFQANLMVRAGRQGKYEEAARIYDRFVATFERTRHPDLSLKRVVKRLGRDKARLVGVDERVIEDAIRNWKRYAL